MCNNITYGHAQGKRKKREKGREGKDLSTCRPRGKTWLLQSCLNWWLQTRSIGWGRKSRGNGEEKPPGKSREEKEPYNPVVCAREDNIAWQEVSSSLQGLSPNSLIAHHSPSVLSDQRSAIIHPKAHLLHFSKAPWLLHKWGNVLCHYQLTVQSLTMV